MSGPQDFQSMDASGLMDKITDLMDDDAVIGAPGTSQRVMVPVKHIGSRAVRVDTFSGSGKTWAGNETHLVTDQQAQILMKFSDVWVFDSEYLAAAKGAEAGMHSVSINVTAADLEAVLNGRADVMVVYREAGDVPAFAPEEVAKEAEAAPKDPEETMTLADLLASLDKEGLIAFAEQENVTINRTFGAERLRAVITEALTPKAAE